MTRDKLIDVFTTRMIAKTLSVMGRMTAAQMTELGDMIAEDLELFAHEAHRERLESNAKALNYLNDEIVRYHGGDPDTPTEDYY